MLFVFQMDEETRGCIAWGKVKMSKNNNSGSPVKITEYEDGTERYMFVMNVNARKVSSNSQKERWVFEDASVSSYMRPEDPVSRRMNDVLKLLRPSDPVVVFGKYSSREWTDYHGVTHEVHDIHPFAIIPTLWVSDLMLAMFAQIIQTKEPMRTKRVKNQAPPVREKAKPAPQVSHPTVIDDEGWEDFY